MSDSKKQLVNGLYFNKKHENAPDFVLGSISINKGMFQNFIEDLGTNKDGYCKFDMLKSKKGKIYFTVNDYGVVEKAEESEDEFGNDEEEDFDVPF